MKIIFLVWLIVVSTISIILYRATRFEYHLVDGILEIKLHWAGLFKIPKRVPLSEIRTVRRLRSLSEILPLFSGTFPSLWGKFTPSRMLIVSLKRSRFFPLIITPDDPEVFISHISPQLPGSED